MGSMNLALLCITTVELMYSWLKLLYSRTSHPVLFPLLYPPPTSLQPPSSPPPLVLLIPSLLSFSLQLSRAGLKT